MNLAYVIIFAVIWNLAKSFVKKTDSKSSKNKKNSLNGNLREFIESLENEDKTKFKNSSGKSYNKNKSKKLYDGDQFSKKEDFYENSDFASLKKEELICEEKENTDCQDKNLIESTRDIDLAEVIVLSEILGPCKANKIV